MQIRDKAEELNRDRGILSPADRKFLIGEIELEEDSKRQARQRVRDRVKHGLRDFWFIRYCLSDRDRELLGDDLFGSDGPVWQGYADMLAFFYKLNVERGASMGAELQHAIKDAEREMNKDTAKEYKITVTFDVEKIVAYDYSQLIEKFEEGEALTPEHGEALIMRSAYFDHLSMKEKWKKYGEFLSGDLESDCIVEDGETDLAASNDELEG